MFTLLWFVSIPIILLTSKFDGSRSLCSEAFSTMAKAELVYLREQNAQLQSQIQSLSANMADTMEGDGSGMPDDSAKLVSRKLAQQHKVREFHGHHDKEDVVVRAVGHYKFQDGATVGHWCFGLHVQQAAMNILFWRSLVWHWEKTHSPQR